MRHIKLTCLLVVCSYATYAQFSIQPQIGLENSKTTIQHNDESLIPGGVRFSPKLSLRMEYKFKKGHGPFIGVSTSAPVVDFNFSDPQTAAATYNAQRDNLQLRFEGGYQLSTKPIYFSSPGKSHASAFRSSGKCGDREKYSCNTKMSCGKSSASRCSKSSNKSIAKNNESYMRIIPSAGLALIPGQPSEIETKTQGTQTTYNYKAGAWHTAFIAGTGFEFGNNGRAKFAINVNYLKGLGNMDTQTINSVSNGKPVATRFSSKASSWSVGLGFPISFSKKPAVQKHVERSRYENKCGQSEKIQYRSGCGQKRI